MARECSLSAARLDAETHLGDELDFADLVAEVEEALEVRIDDGGRDQGRTLGDLVRVIDGRQSK